MESLIVTTKSWHLDLVNKLQDVTQHRFSVISDPSELTINKIEQIRPDYIFFPHWSFLIPKGIYEKYECVVFHMTDLPYGRGGSPLQNLIIRGHQETKLSAIKCIKELDAGPIYMQEKLSLNGSAEEIFLRASDLIETMIINIILEKPKPVEQEGNITIFSRRTPEQGDWADAKSLGEIFDRIRMLDAEGYSPAFIVVGQYKVEFTRASRKVDNIIADVKISRIEK